MGLGVRFVWVSTPVSKRTHTARVDDARRVFGRGDLLQARDLGGAETRGEDLHADVLGLARRVEGGREAAEVVGLPSERARGRDGEW